MRISRPVGVMMMHAMGGNPDQGSAFQAQCGAYRQQMLHPPRYLVAAVGEQTMVTHADPGIDRDYVKRGGNNKRGPTKEEKRCHSSNMEENHEAEYQPIQRQPLCIAREREHRRLPRRPCGRRQANISAGTHILNRSKGWNSDDHSDGMIYLRRCLRHSFVMTGK